MFGAYGGPDTLLTGSVPAPETEALSDRFRPFPFRVDRLRRHA
jgi:hypothetical protein